MKADPVLFLDGLIDEVSKLIDHTNDQFGVLNEESLLWKPNEKSWSIIECFNHLLLANEFYLIQIIEALNDKDNLNFKQTGSYRRGRVGKYIASRIRPKKNGKLGSKMKTFKSMEPKINDQFSTIIPNQILDSYVQQLSIIKQKIELAKKVSLKNSKISTALGRWVKLELGNAFDFLVGHNVRHVKQADNVFNKMKKEL